MAASSNKSIQSRPRLSDVRALFRRIKVSYNQQSSPKTGLACTDGFYRGCAVLKLQKRSWTNQNVRGGRGESGIFFSIWTSAADLASLRANYNIHALKLRQLESYAITSIAFAKNFRAAFAPLVNSWPNVNLDFGPQTLMQGWILIRPKRFERDLVWLLKRFARASRIVDSLLLAA